MQIHEGTSQPVVSNLRLQREARKYNPAEQALLERYRFLFEEAPSGIAISDQEGNILDANPEMQRITGYSLEELQMIGTEALCADPGLCHAVLEALSVSGKAQDREVRLTRKDGTTYDALLHVAQIKLEGQAICFTYIRDITKRKRAEEALRESEERFRLITETIDEVFWVFDVENWKLLYVSPAHERIWGFPRQGIYENLKFLFDPIHPDDRERVAANMTLMKTGQPIDHEYRIIRPDGSFRQIWDRGFPIKDENGRINRYVGVAQDVTERRRMEGTLKESTEYMNQLINRIGDPIFVKDRKHRLVLVNDALCTFAGKSREQMLGKTGYEFIPKEQAISFWEQEENVFNTGREFVTEDNLTDGRGDTHAIMTRKARLMDKSGNKQIVGVIRDITERKRAEEALRESEERYRTAIEHSNDGVAIATGTTNLFVNQRYADMFGYDKPEEIVGKPLSLIVHPDDLKRVEEVTLRRLQGETVPSRYEIKGIRKDGDPIDIEITATQTVYRGKAVTLAYLRDITKHKRAEEEKEKLQEQVRQSQKMEAIGMLAGGVAHDFNNLLSVINGYSELLLDPLAEDDPKRPDLEQIKQAGQRAASLTSQLLSFSRKQILKPEILDLNTTITDMSKMLRRLIGEDIELKAIMKPGLGLVNADPGQIQQIIMNLAVNARDAMPQGGKLTIETADVDLDEDYIRKHSMLKAGPYVMLAISDNGIGMDAATRAHLFEPFFTTKGMGRGTGLGLSTVYGIVKQSSGFIWVYSEPGKGTSFKIYFPRAEGEITKLTGKGKSELGFRGFETVLVVEDETPVRTLASRILRDRGYNVLEAADGMEALRIAQEYSREIHLILTDVVMPGISGSTLVSRLEAARPGIKALYVSGYTDNAIVHHGMLDSNVAFLQKPFSTDGLLRKVREVIDS